MMTVAAATLAASVVQGQPCGPDTRVAGHEARATSAGESACPAPDSRATSDRDPRRMSHLASNDVQKGVVPGTAAAKIGICSKYAEHAVDQFKRTHLQGCGLQPDDRWQDNLDAHYHWCLEASDQARAAEQKARSDWLWSCGALGDRGKDKRCDSYAFRAVEHFRLTRQPGCGVRGDGRWQSDYDAHYAWCLKASDAALAGEEKARSDWLLRCGGFGFKVLDEWCYQYARRAVDQFKLTARPGCAVGPDGRWQGNFDAHYEWCLDASQAARASEQEARDQWLYGCGAQIRFD